MLLIYRVNQVNLVQFVVFVQYAIGTVQSVLS